jgi:protein PET100, fungi type
MYYFGTNLDERFSVKGFWPTSEQSHKIPDTKEEINAELTRMRMKDAVLRERRLKAESEASAASTTTSLRFSQTDSGRSS